MKRIAHYKGVVEELSSQGLSGWAVSEDENTPMGFISIWLGDKLIGVVSPTFDRPDIVDAGDSKNLRCGFKFIYPEVISPDQISRVKVYFDNGDEIPLLANFRNFDIYDLLFDGAQGRDTSLPFTAFQSFNYIRHNARRLEHLSSLGLDLIGKKVLELGAGSGDHTSFYLDRQCDVVATDARQENIDFLLKRLSNHKFFKKLKTSIVDVEKNIAINEVFDIVHCYGLLYHIAEPKKLLYNISRLCKGMVIIETKCMISDENNVVFGDENKNERYHSVSGTNFRPSRTWLHSCLSDLFEYVYWPITQPNHEEFPLDFELFENHFDHPRAIVIASRFPIENHMLQNAVPVKYKQN